MRKEPKHQQKIWLTCSIVFIIVIGIVIAPTFSQKNLPSKASLEKKQKELVKQINYNQKLLDEVRKSRELSLNELAIINVQIKKREQLIHTIKSEIEYYNNQIATNEKHIAQLEDEIAKQKQQYAKLILLSYKLRNNNDKFLYLFAADDVKQAWYRVKYFVQLSKYRIQRFDELEEARQRIILANNQLERQISEKVALSSYKMDESQKLNGEHQLKSRAVEQIKKDEQHILQKLNQQRKESEKLANQIQTIIHNELERAKKIAASKALERKKTLESAVSSTVDFSLNKGKLPWPTKSGTVCSTFGRHKHPDFDIYTENNGIDILTVTGAVATSVFKGEVSEVIKLPSYYAVLIKHGDYFTLYSKIEEVWVKKGDKVTMGHKLGLIKTFEGVTQLHFEIWHQKEKQNPQSWITG
ncbi:MAG: peptidoglycan DD-metalloendopeptidase family protein [Bacteroidales bacterium]|nr:peptidoglycan DD-metalloendopeptidase family protein [Bacteroidales bacterium]